MSRVLQLQLCMIGDKTVKTFAKPLGSYASFWMELWFGSFAYAAFMCSVSALNIFVDPWLIVCNLFAADNNLG